MRFYKELIDFMHIAASPKDETFEALKLVMPYCKQIQFTGSRIICNPAPTDTDLDILLLVNYEDKSYSKLMDALEKAGYELGGSLPGVFVEDGPSSFDFNSLKLGSINFILTFSQQYFDKFVEATRRATALNLLDKQDRIGLFQRVLYGVGNESFEASQSQRVSLEWISYTMYKKCVAWLGECD